MVYSAKSDDALTVSQFTRLKYIKITTNGTSTPANYQVKLTIAYEPEMQADFRDIRFNTIGHKYIDYWIESKTDSVTATVWVKLPNAITDPGSDTIWMYYGNAGLSDGGVEADVFDWYDEIDDNTGWTTISGTPIFSGGTVISADADIHADIRKSISLSSNNYKVLIRQKHGTSESFYGYFRVGLGTWDGSFDGYGGEGALYHQSTPPNRHLDVLRFDNTAIKKIVNGHNITVATTDWVEYTLFMKTTGEYRFISNYHASHDSGWSSVDTTYSQPWDTIYLMMRSLYSKIDWIRIVKYITNEPTYSIGTAQHQRRVPQFM